MPTAPQVVTASQGAAQASPPKPAPIANGGAPPPRLHDAQGDTTLFREAGNQIIIIDSDDEDALAVSTTHALPRSTLQTAPTLEPQLTAAHLHTLPPHLASSTPAESALLPTASRVVPGHSFSLGSRGSSYSRRGTNAPRAESTQNAVNPLPSSATLSVMRTPSMAAAVAMRTNPSVVPSSAGGGRPSTLGVRADDDSKHGLTTAGIQTLLKHNGLTADADTEAATPPQLNIELLPHQKRGLEWMARRERPLDDDEVVVTDEQCLGGILADEQGLGKTLTMVALMLKNPPGPLMRRRGQLRRVPWRSLVVCPLSLLHQWREEIETNVKDKPIVYIYHGTKRERNHHVLADCDVVITTYTMLSSEYPKVLENLPENRLRKEANLELLKRSPGPLYCLQWHRIVLDEAHYVKNRNTECWQAAMDLKAEVRWCMTGTPISNSVDDIYSLFCFVRYRFVGSHKDWVVQWKKKLESSFTLEREQAFRRFQTICGVVVLRRTKKDHINGRPLLVLPERKVNMVVTNFEDAEESAVYQALQAQSVLKVNKYLMGRGAALRYSTMMVLLLRLRQACCHPFLVQYSRMRGNRKARDLDERYATPYSEDDIQEALELLEGQQSLLEVLDEGVRERVESSLLPPEKGPIVQWGPFRCQECSQLFEWKHGVFLVCGDLVCEGCGLRCSQARKCLRCGASLVAPSEGSDVVLGANEVRLEVHAKVIMGIDELGGSVDAGEVRLWVRQERERRKKDFALRRRGRESEGGGLSLAGKTGRVDSGDERRENFLQAFTQSSTKLRRIVSELGKTRDEGAGEKTIVFSQWTTMLDMIEFHAEANGHETCRLDGTMRTEEREEAIKEFKTSTSKNAMLVSLHAGGTGLNLTVASRVIIADVWWNPCVEEQAIDRTHRIGQTRKVLVTRFRMDGTIEDKIYAINEQKKRKVAGALGESSSSSLGRRKLTMSEMMILFSGTAEEVAERETAGSAAAEAARNILKHRGQHQIK